jgi:RNA polymerase sigma factor (sigma-70 family)
MAASATRLLDHLRRLVQPPAPEPAPDAALLERFARDRDEAAFAALLARHGPLVLGVCRRLLGDVHAAEDAFQATFLVLARKAGTLRHRDKLAGWLYGVACRVARKARAAARGRRAAGSGNVAEAADGRPDPLAEVSARELLQVLEEEVQRLPAAYRLPVILCCLEGRSREEAAELLGWKLGAVKGRLERGRRRLHARLTRRGLELAVALGALEAARGAAEALPPLLAASTARAAAAFAAGATPAGTAAPALAEEVLLSAAGLKLKGALAFLLAAALLVGAGLAAYQAGQVPPPPPAERPDRPGAPTVSAAAPRDDEPLPPGAIARLGTARFRHPGGAAAVLFGPAGKQLLSGGNDNSVILWDAGTGRPRWTFGEYASFIGVLRPSMALSPDGKAVVIGRGSSVFIDSGWQRPLLAVLEARTGKKVRELWTRRSNSVVSLAISRDGKTLAATAEDGAALVWDLAGGREKPGPALPRGTRYRVAFTPDGKALVLASAGWSDIQKWAQPAPGEVRLWDLSAGRERRRFVVDPKSGVSGLVLAPDGDTVAVQVNNAAGLWRLSTGRKLRDLKPGADVRCVAFSPDGRALALGCYQRPSADNPGGAVYLLAPATGKGRLLMRTFANSVAFSPDGRRLATAGLDSIVRLWDARTGAPVLASGGLSGAVRCLAFSPDGRTLVAGADDGTARIWDTRTGSQKLSRRLVPTLGHEVVFGTVGFGPGGRVLATPSTTPTAPSAGRRAALVWDVRSGKGVVTITPSKPQAGGTPVCPVTLSPDGRLVAVSERSVVVFREVSTGRERARLRRQEGGIYGIWFTADGRKVATYCNPRGRGGSSGDPVIRLWDVATGRELASIRDRYLEPFAPSPDGRRGVTGGVTGPLTLWDLQAGQVLRRTPDVLPGRPTCLAFSPDGRLVACGTPQGHVVLFDVAGARAVARRKGHRGGVTALAFSRDGRRLASAGLDTTVLVWDLAALRRRADAP